MIIDLKAVTRGILNPANIRNLEKKINKEFVRAYNKVAIKVADESKTDLRAKVRRNYKLNGNKFINSFRTKFFDKKKNVPGGLAIYTRTTYYDIFNYGGTITKKRLIPITARGSKRISQKAFENVLTGIFNSGDYYWKNNGTNSVLYAIITKKNKVSGGGFKKQYKNNKGIKSIKSDGKTSIPVAVLVKQGDMKKRVNIAQEELKSTINKIRTRFPREFNVNNIT